MNTSEKDWPDDVNGNVFRSLSADGFDFDKECIIDINLDFDHWPLTSGETIFLKTQYSDIQIINPDPGEDIGNGVDVGFVQFQIQSILTYEFITDLQAEITANVSSIGGWCNSWGVMQD